MARNTIPLFPLSIVVFPGEELKLHIFEPRYKQLVHDCLKEGISFGIPPYIEGKSLIYGTELILRDVIKSNENGTLDIKAKAIGWFEIVDFFKILHGKLYPGGVIKRNEWNNNGDISHGAKLTTQIAELYRIMNIKNIDIPAAEEFKTYMLGHKIGLNIEQELQLLTITDEVDKQLFLIDHLQHLIPIVNEAENLRKKAELNGHFQHILPPNL